MNKVEVIDGYTWNLVLEELIRLGKGGWIIIITQAISKKVCEMCFC